MSAANWHLSVERAEFAKALRSVGRTAMDNRSARAVLTFEQGFLAIELCGCAVQVAATGDWPNEVRLPGTQLERLAKVLPGDDPLPIKVEGDRLFVANFSIPCEWRLHPRPASTPIRELTPANADLFDVLMAASRCSEEEIDAAGAKTLVSDALSRLDMLCTRAASFLGPYRVSAADLRRLCEARIEEGSRQFRDSDAKTVSQIAQAWCILAPMGVEPREIKALMDKCLRNAWK